MFPLAKPFFAYRPRNTADCSQAKKTQNWQLQYFIVPNVIQKPILSFVRYKRIRLLNEFYVYCLRKDRHLFGF